MRYSEPTGRFTSDRNADAFVDDTRIGFNDEKNAPMDAYHHNAEYTQRMSTTLGKSAFLLRRRIVSIEMLLSNDALALG